MVNLILKIASLLRIPPSPMIVNNTSDFQLSVYRVKSTFRDFQNSLEELKESPLTLSSDIPHITMWSYKKCIKSLFNVFCLPIDFKVHSTIRPEDLEEFKYIPDDCKLQYKTDELNHMKIQSIEQKGSNSERFQQSDFRQIQANDSSFTGQNRSTNKRDYKRGPYKNYTVDQKLEAVKMLVQDHCSVVEVSRKLKIPCKNIKRWSQYGVERKKGGGRKRFSPQTERSVALHLKAIYKQGLEVEYEKVQQIARRMSEDPTFKASRGWVVKFVERQHLRNYYKFV